VTGIPGNFPVLFPDEYRGGSRLKTFQLTPAVEFTDDEYRSQTFLRLISQIKEPIFIKLFGDHQRYKLICTVRDRDSSLLSNAMIGAFPDWEISRESVDPFISVLQEMVTVKNSGYVFDLFTVIPLSPSIGIYFSPESVSEFHSNLFKFFTMDLDEKECSVFQVALTPCQNDWGSLFADTIQISKRLIREKNWMPPNVKSLADKVSAVPEKDVLKEFYWAISLRFAIIAKSNKASASIRQLRQNFALLGIPHEIVDRNYLRRCNVSNKTIRDTIVKHRFIFPGVPVPESEIIKFLPFSAVEKFSSTTRQLLMHDMNSNGNEEQVPPKIIGIYRYGHREFEVKKPPNLECLHSVIIGSTGVGKSIILLNHIAYDIKIKRGVCVIDPHGDIARNILKFIPKSRIEDVVYFNPADPVFAFQFNLLQLGLSVYESVNVLLDVFQSIFDEWSYRQINVLQYCLIVLIHIKNATIRDVMRLLLDPAFRTESLGYVKDPNILDWWAHFDRFPRDLGNSISYKIDQLTTSPLISQVINQPKNCLNLFEIMAHGKILIADFPKGRLGSDACRLLGTILVSLIHIGALKRENIPISERKGFNVYVDEFQNFLTPSIAGLLEEGRKYSVGLHLATQGIAESNLPKNLRGAILANTLTKMAFRCGIHDAELIAPEFPGFRAEDIVNLPKYHALIRMGDQTVRIKTLPPPIPTDDHSAEIIELNRQKYCYKRLDESESAPNHSGNLELFKYQYFGKF